MKLNEKYLSTYNTVENNNLISFDFGEKLILHKIMPKMVDVQVMRMNGTGSNFYRWPKQTLVDYMKAGNFKPIR